MKPWVLLVAVMCGCSGKPTTTTGGTGSGGSSAPVITNATRCADVKLKVEQLYRAEGQAKEPKRVDAFVADNTTMVMTDCAKDPASFVPCIAKAQSIAELEQQCLVPLDEEGTEAEPK